MVDYSLPHSSSPNISTGLFDPAKHAVDTQCPPGCLYLPRYPFPLDKVAPRLAAVAQGEIGRLSSQETTLIIKLCFRLHSTLYALATTVSLFHHIHETQLSSPQKDLAQESLPSSSPSTTVPINSLDSACMRASSSASKSFSRSISPKSSSSP